MRARCGCIKADLATLGPEAIPKNASACRTEARFEVTSPSGFTPSMRTAQPITLVLGLTLVGALYSALRLLEAENPLLLLRLGLLTLIVGRERLTGPEGFDLEARES